MSSVATLPAIESRAIDVSSSAPLDDSLFDIFDLPEEPQLGQYVAPVAKSAPLIAIPRKDHEKRVLEPRWYQSVAWKMIDEGFFVKKLKNQLLVLPTGCGKTCVASQFAKERLDAGEPVLILTNRDKLLSQMYDDLSEEKIFPLIEKAEQSALRHFGTYGNCVLGSAQTLHEKRLQGWPRDAFRWIIIDEAHGSLAPQILRIIEWFSGASVLGLTATPERADGQDLKRVYAYPWIRPITLRQAIEGWNALTGQYEQPFLSRILLRTIDTDIDLRQVGIVGKDFDQKELDRIIWENTNFLATKIRENAVRDDGTRRPTIFFTPHVNSAEAISAALRDMGERASAISYKSENIADIYERYQSGALDHLGNVAILTEGVNIPKIECIGLCRPMLNVGPVTQMIGRGTRKSPQTGKENCLILEFACKTDEKKTLASVIDTILDGAEDDGKPNKERREMQFRVRAKTHEIVKSGEESDIIKAHSMAKERLDDEERRRIQKAREAKQEARRAKYQESNVAAAVYDYDPFAGFNKEQKTGDSAARPLPASEEQKQRVLELSKGKINPTRLSTDDAASQISRLEFRQRIKLASEPQLCLIEKINKIIAPEDRVDMRTAANFKKWDAAAWIDAHWPPQWVKKEKGA